MIFEPTPFDPDPFILTLRMDDAARAHFTALRARYFPPARNHLDAHITLFHKLPADQETALQRDLTDVASVTAPFAMATDGTLFFGAGTAYRVQAPGAVIVRASLATCWHAHLVPQDQKKTFTPHITVQNKVSAAMAREVYAQLTTGFTPYAMTAVGLDLWRYRGGPWDAVAFYPFRTVPAG